MSDSPNIDKAPGATVLDDEAARKPGEEFTKPFATMGGEPLKTVKQLPSGQAPKDKGLPPEISPEPECWKAFDDMAKKHIPDTAKMLLDQLNNVLLFATLFSAINSAFLIYTLPTATTSVQDPTNRLLLYVIRSLNNESAEEATNFLAGAESSGHTVNLVVNATFSISFVLSIIGTLIAVLGQTWVTNYGRNIAVDPTELRAEQKQKLCGADRWHFQSVLEIVLPLILQTALIVFCAGFMVLLWNINTTLAIWVLPFLAVGLLAIGATIGFALWDPGCPYQTPISSRILPTLLSGAYWLPHWLFVILAALMIQLEAFLLIISGPTLRALTWDRIGMARQERMKKGTWQYKRNCEVVGAKLRRPIGSTGMQCADIVAWTLKHSSDPIAVSRVCNILLHGDAKHALDIANDVYLHPVYEQLLSTSRKHMKSTVTNLGDRVWKASCRAMWHIFLASSAALPVPAHIDVDVAHTGFLLQLEDLRTHTQQIFDHPSLDPARSTGGLGLLDELLELAACFKLLKLVASEFKPNLTLSNSVVSGTSSAKLLQRMDLIVDLWVKNDPLAFRQLHYLSEIICTLMKEAGDSTANGTRAFSLYTELRRDYQSVWDGGNRPPLRMAHSIPLGSMVGIASTPRAFGSEFLQAAFGKFLTKILDYIGRPELQGEVVESEFIYAQLKELKLLLNAIPQGQYEIQLRSLQGPSCYGEGRWVTSCFDTVTRLSSIQRGTVSLASKLVAAGTSRSISGDNHWSAKVAAGVGRYLLEIVNLLPKKDEARSIALDHLQFFLADSNFSSLDWGTSGESIHSMFELCRAITKLGKRDQETKKIDRWFIEELSPKAAIINHKTLESISKRSVEIIKWSERIHDDEHGSPRGERFNITEHLTDFLRGAKVENLTEKQWSGLVHIESSLKSFYQPSVREYYDLPPGGTEYLEQMKIAHDKREPSTTSIADGHARPADLQGVTVV